MIKLNKGVKIYNVTFLISTLLIPFFEGLKKNLSTMKYRKITDTNIKT